MAILVLHEQSLVNESSDEPVRRGFGKPGRMRQVSNAKQALLAKGFEHAGNTMDNLNSFFTIQGFAMSHNVSPLIEYNVAYVFYTVESCSARACREYSQSHKACQASLCSDLLLLSSMVILDQMWWGYHRMDQKLSGKSDALGALAFCRSRKLRTLEMEPHDRPCGPPATMRHQTLFLFLV